MDTQHPKCFSGALILSIFFSWGYTALQPTVYAPPYQRVDSHWVDTTLSHLSIDEKIGQLFILTTTIPQEPNLTHQLIKNYQPGGILMHDISKSVYWQNIQEIRALLNISLFEFSDASTSFNNQLSDLPDYPKDASLSAINKSFLISALERKLISDFQHAGINCSLSPNIQAFENNESNYNADLQPKNEQQMIKQAADKVVALQAAKILAIANSFEVFVNSLADSTFIQQRYIDQYKPLIDNGLSGIILGEKIFDGDSTLQGLPEFYKNILYKHLQFDGLIFGKITKNVSLETLIDAGASNFLVTEAIFAKNVTLLKEMVVDGRISEAELDKKVRKILMAKKWLELDQKNYSQTVSHTATTVVDNPKEALYVRELFQNSIVLANNPDSLLPLFDTYANQIKVVNIGYQPLRKFQNSFFNYANFSSHLYRPKKDGKINGLAFNPIRNGVYVITLDNINLSANKHKEFLTSVHTLNESSNVVVVNFGNPHNFSLLDSTITAIQVFERNDITEDLIPQLIFGGIEARGAMPIEIASWLPKGRSLSTPINRLEYSIPEAVGISSKKLDKIQEIMESAIRQKATPGGQILIAKSGKVIYSKSFGYHTYEGKQRVEQTDLYDVASITKPAATTLTAMRLYEEESIFLKQPLKDQMYLASSATIGNILLKDLFIHKSGLQRNMPIANYLNNKGIPADCTPYFCRNKTEKYDLEVAKDFYFNTSHLDSLYLTVSHLPRKYRHRKYLYSDVNFYLIHQLLEDKMNANLDDYLKWNFYEPLGLRYCTFKPLDRFPADVIVPTQNDKFWRKNLVRGYVHDESAAILGGVGGNAGLFANAQDLAVVFQMLLNGGEYGGYQFFEKETIDYFTSVTHGNHRGLGFDNARYNYTASKSASKRTFGHSGFSGTCVWVDPDEELIYIFLSNRIHPNPRNNQLKKMRVRQRVHEVIYEALKSSRSNGTIINMAGD